MLARIKSMTNSKKTIYGAVLPAPNPTGELHMGHFLNLSIQDVFCRWRKGHGDTVVWASALDHGGSSTEYVVVKNDVKLREGDADKIIIAEKINSWIESITPVIQKQIKDMHLIIDDSEERSMGDEQREQEFRCAIKTLGKKGLLFQADRVVPWCSKRGTFVDATDIQICEVMCTIHKFVYRTDNGNKIVIEMLEPVTMLNDVALVVSSAFYSTLVENTKTVINPLGRSIPLFVDDAWLQRFDDRDLMVVTPGHCKHSFLWALKRGMEISRVFDEVGSMLGTDHLMAKRDEFERHVLLQSESNNSYLGSKEIVLPRECYRVSGSPVEYLLTRQCFLDVTKVSRHALNDIQSGKILIEPKLYRCVLEQYLEKLSKAEETASGELFQENDICISQQTVWGTSFDVNDSLIHFRGPRYIEQKFDCSSQQIATMRLSCALWAFSALKVYQSNNKKLQLLGRNSICVTGMDLTTFWIAPIIMLAPALGFYPFKYVYIHPLICDAKGYKMSKSLGNTQTPKELIDSYGVDAVRLALLTSIDNKLHRVVLDTSLMAAIKELLDMLLKKIGAYSSIEIINLSEKDRPAEYSIIDQKLTALDIAAAANIAKLKIEEFVYLSESLNIRTLNSFINEISPFVPVISLQLKQLVNRLQ
jgi:valyl-tRNA synthetase